MTATMMDVAQALLEKMPGASIEKVYDCSVRVEYPDGFGVFLSTQRDHTGKKLHVGGNYPQRDGSLMSASSWIYGAKDPSINCSLSRGVDAVVKDIFKRFMPEYELICEQIREKIRDREQYRAGVQNTLSQLEQAVPGLRTDPSRESFHGPDCTGKVYNGKVSIDTSSVSVDKAIRILKILAEDK